MKIASLVHLQGAARLAGIGALAAAMLGAPTARAQQPSKAELDKARSAFQEGVALAAANNCAGALVKYKAVMQVKVTPQVAFNVAECEERLGKLVSALGNYRLAASQAADDKRAVNVLKEVPARIADVESRIPKLTITRGKGADAATIELDGTEIGTGQIGAASPQDPGPHVIVARLGTKEYVRETVTLAEKESKTFVVKLNLPDKVVEAPPSDGPAEPPPPPPKSRVPGAVVTAIGGASLITGFVALGLRGGALSDLDKVCNAQNQCPASAKSTGDSGKLYTGLAEVTVVAGVVGLATGIALLATSGPQKPKKVDASKSSVHLLAAAPGASIGGLSLAGSF